MANFSEISGRLEMDPGPQTPAAPTPLTGTPFLQTSLGQGLAQGVTNYITATPAWKAGEMAMGTRPISGFGDAARQLLVEGVDPLMSMPGAPKVIPPVQMGQLKRLYEKSAKLNEPGWYAGSKEMFDEMYGSQSNLSRGFNAITSQQKPPSEQARLANIAQRLYNEKGIGALERTPVMGTQKRELQKMAEMWEQDPMAWLGDALSAGSLKRRDYYGSLGGEGIAVIDRHIGAAGYKDPTYFSKNANDPRVYRPVQEVINYLAGKRGVTFDEYQAGIWRSWRRLQGLPESGNEPFKEILRRVGEASPDYQWLKKSGVLERVSPANKTRLASIFALMGLETQLPQSAPAGAQ